MSEALQQMADDYCSYRCGDYPENPNPPQHTELCRAVRASLRGGPPLEPSEEALTAAVNTRNDIENEEHRRHDQRPDHLSVWDIRRVLRAAYAIDGLRPSQESTPPPSELERNERRSDGEWLTGTGEFGQ